jgi:hypothetical protein
VTKRKIKTLKRKGKINTSSEDDLPEDRLKPYTNQRKDSSNSIKEIETDWICSSCKNTNKRTHKKCTSKKKFK